MTAPDLHPEDLIERDDRGRLTASERARLEAHVRHCAVCRMTRMARVDFEREVAHLSPGIDVGRVVAGLLVPTVPRKRTKSVLTSGLGRTSLCAALVLMAGLGAAAVRSASVRGPSRSGASTIVATSPSRGRFAGSPPPASATSPAVDAERGETAESGETDAIRPRRLAGGGSKSSLPVGSSLADRPSASELFERAAAARHAGDHSRAAGLYRSLIRTFPGSPEAHTALALFGRMLLDDGDDAGAVVQFDRYLQTDGVLEQDALVGRALALERLGRTADASQAWLAILRWYPNSAHADRARIHLSALAQR